jgi:hypothetical protein
MADYMSNYGPMFLLVMVGAVVLICVFISQISNSFAIVAALAGLAFFAYVMISQLDRLTTTRWTIVDVIVVAAMLFIVIWITPDIIRRRNRK